MVAATGGRYEKIVEYLVNHKADINIQDINWVSTCEVTKTLQLTTILCCSDIILMLVILTRYISQTPALLSAYCNKDIKLLYMNRHNDKMHN